MRIVYVGDMTSIHMRRWAGFVASRGHEVHVITTKPYDGPLPPKLTMHELLAPRSKIPGWRQLLVALSIARMVKRLRALLTALRPDVVHVHYINEAALWTVLARPSGLIVTAWGSDITVAPVRSPVRQIATRYVLTHADMLTCDADHMKSRMEALGAPSARTRVVFFGTDVARFHPSKRDSELRRRYGPGGAPLIISIRALEPIYDIPTLIRAVPLVLEALPRARFLIGGNGTLADALKEQVRAAGVHKSVVFLGSLTQDQLPPMLASCDVYVSTALSDGGLASSTAEAMAACTPVIISDVGDNAKWVRQWETGALFPAGDERALAQAITRMVGDPGLAQQLGQAGRAEIEQRSNLYVEMDKMQRLYEEVAGMRR